MSVNVYSTHGLVGDRVKGFIDFHIDKPRRASRGVAEMLPTAPNHGLCAAPLARARVRLAWIFLGQPRAVG